MRAYLQINGSQAKEVWGTVVAKLPLTVTVSRPRHVSVRERGHAAARPVAARLPG